MSLETFTQAYIECALWADAPENNRNINFIDFPLDIKEEMSKDAKEFYENYNHMWHDDEQAGHDFWLTRQGHGAGFWDRDKSVYGEFADLLTKNAQWYGEVWYDWMAEDSDWVESF